MLSFLCFVLVGILFDAINGHLGFHKSILLFSFGGFFYLPIFMISNSSIYFFKDLIKIKLPVSLTSFGLSGLLVFLAITFKLADDFLWVMILGAQSIVSAYQYHSLKRLL